MGTVVVSLAAALGACSFSKGIIQFPSAANDWELIALVSDYMVGGAYDKFTLELDVVPN